jgi:hypothetical protein
MSATRVHKMHNTRDEFDKRHLEGEENNKKFQTRIEELRAERSERWFSDEVFLSHFVDCAVQIFPTPQERYKYAVPYLLHSMGGDWSFREADDYFTVLGQWGLKDNLPAVRDVLNYIADHKFWGKSNFVGCFGRLVRDNLPEGEKGIVFEKALRRTGHLMGFSRYADRAREFAEVARDYVAPDRWPDAYRLFKKSLLDTLCRNDRFGNARTITTEGTEKVAEMLGIFAESLPLSKKMQRQVCEDVVGLLDNPQSYVKGREVVAGGFLFASPSRPGIIRFTAKKNFDPTSLDAQDYQRVLEDLQRPDSKGSFSDKADLLKEAAQTCLPEENRNETFVRDLLCLAAAELQKDDYPKFGDTVKGVIKAFGDMNLSRQDKEFVVKWVEGSAREFSLKGKTPDDDSILSAFRTVSAGLLNKEDILAWIARQVEIPFLELSPAERKAGFLPPRAEDYFPFLGFICYQFKAAAGGDKQTPLAAGNVAAGYFGEKLVLAFSKAAVVDAPEDQEVLILNLLDYFVSAPEMRQQVVREVSSIPDIRRAHLSRFDELVDLVSPPKLS